MGGENVLHRVELPELAGSSPRGRGKRVDQGLDGGGRGLIPAWAGKTTAPPFSTRCVTAHPRVGGENGKPTWPAGWGPGSSPRGRGKLGRHRQRLPRVGLIPAWAGKTARSPEPGSRRAAHPRVGGENFGDHRVSVTAWGSSPRGRGKLLPVLRGVVGRGLIPAWAGKTCGVSSQRTKCRAHPRVGGENAAGPGHPQPVAGSSPRGRGKPLRRRRPLHEGGLIPAWAGKTTSTYRAQSAPRAHPRVGGENPPHLRALVRRGRLIPAWAGKTAPPNSPREKHPAHPRVGGENFPRARSAADAGGSSPRGRGKRADAGLLVREFGSSPRGRGKRYSSQLVTMAYGLIPAWAGKT